MGLGYRLFVRPMIAIQDSENAHTRTVRSLRIFSNNILTRSIISLLYKPKRKLPVRVFDIDYNHPFGLAAGMDKKGEAINGWQSIGLSFTEIGGVTMLEQSGNPKPRMFRSNKHKALVNRMGFNNPGSDNMQKSLSKHFDKFGKPDIPVWVNLGKSKLTENNDAHNDYSTTLERLWKYSDLFVINVSSPNTPNLRDLQGEEELRKIISKCMEINNNQAAEHGSKQKPILVKVAPDMSLEQLEQIVTVAIDEGCSGIVATNTTISRPDEIKGDLKLAETGGMSGKPLRDKSTEFISHIYQYTNGEFPIVGVGGIMNAQDAWEKITAGASLIQAYSGFVFEGPSLSKQIINGLHKRMKEHNLTNIQDAVGLSHRS